MGHSLEMLVRYCKYNYTSRHISNVDFNIVGGQFTKLPHVIGDILLGTINEIC